MYLIYAQDSDGNQGFYRFDGSNGSCLRYVADPDTDLQASADSLSAELSSLQEDYNSMSSQNSDEIEKLNNSANLQQQNYNNLKGKGREVWYDRCCSIGSCDITDADFLYPYDLKVF